MPNEPRFHPVYKSINKPLTIWGTERKLFFLAMVMGAGTFNFFGSLICGLAMFLALYLLARWAIRHVYLDFDDNGTAAVQALFQRQDLPTPSHVLNTSPDKWQVTWRVEGSTKDEAENLQRALARETGADLAATDCARVLRLPGFYNHKYDRPHLVSVEPHAAIAGLIYRPEQFPKFPRDERAIRRQPNETGQAGTRSHPPGAISQSERDWAFARRALARGEPAENVIVAIANYRRHEKHNPQYYAEHTVRKAVQSLGSEASPARTTEPER